eukprot:jgi/Botrbrau1/7763/Bobra.0159s0192.1
MIWGSTLHDPHSPAVLHLMKLHVEGVPEFNHQEFVGCRHPDGSPEQAVPEGSRGGPAESPDIRTCPRRGLTWPEPPAAKL